MKIGSVLFGAGSLVIFSVNYNLMKCTTKHNLILNDDKALIPYFNKNESASLKLKSDVFYNHKQHFKNNPPHVKIIYPEKNIHYEFNSPIRYAISVSDKEDGESKYGEIIPNEVSLEIRYSTREAQVVPYNKSIKKDLDVLSNLPISTCFNCHAIKRRIIGPSFQDVANKYADSPLNRKMLVNRILNGSTGIWGNQTMPKNHELTQTDAEKIIAWIMKNSSDPQFDFHLGLEGTFILKPPDKLQYRGVYVLIARYTDHGLEGNSNQSLTNSAVIFLN